MFFICMFLQLFVFSFAVTEKTPNIVSTLLSNVVITIPYYMTVECSVSRQLVLSLLMAELFRYSNAVFYFSSNSVAFFVSIILSLIR